MLITIDSKDIKIDTFKAAHGPGGRNKNSREKAVRVTHLPTGITAESTNERSQLHNKKIALEILLDRIREHFLNLQRQSKLASYLAKEKAGFGAEPIRTYRFVGDAQTIDHGSGESLPTKDVLNGRLDLFIRINLYEKARSA